MSVQHIQHFLDFMMDTHSQIIEHSENLIRIRKDDMVLSYYYSSRNECIQIYDYVDYIEENKQDFAKFKKQFIKYQEARFIKELLEPKVDYKPKYGFIDMLT